MSSDANASSDDGFVFPRMFAHANHESIAPPRVSDDVLWNNQCAALAVLEEEEDRFANRFEFHPILPQVSSDLAGTLQSRQNHNLLSFGKTHATREICF